MVDMPSFDIEGGFEAWLKDRPSEWAQVLAVRAALRVFPLLLPALVDEPANALRQDAVMRVFRGIFVAWTARSNPQRDMRSSAVSAANGLSASVGRGSDCVRAVMRAARAVGYPSSRAVADGLDSIEASIAATDKLDDAAVKQMRTAILNDCRILVANSSNLIGEPLWISDVLEGEDYNANFPKWVRTPFDLFANSDMAKASSWGLIADWYRAILPNGLKKAPSSLFGKDKDIEIAIRPDEFWNGDPQRVMDKVAKNVGWVPASADEPMFYNLIVSGVEGSWDGDSGKMPRERFLEHTRSDIATRFKSVERTFEQILRMPTILAYENHLERPARVVRLMDLHTLNPKELQFLFVPDSRFEPISVGGMYKLRMQLDIDPEEFQRTHWAIKEADLFEILGDYLISVAQDNPFDNEDEIVEIPSQEPAPIETAIVDDSVVRVHSDHAATRPDIEAIHAILVVEAGFLAERINRQAPDVVASINSVSQELGARLDEMRVYGVGYWAGVLNQIAGRIDEEVLDDAAGRFAGFLSNLNLFLRHSEDWNAYIRTAQNAELAGIAGSEAQSQTPRIIEELAEYPDIVDEEVSGPLASLNNALLDAQMYNPETAYGLYRSLANVLQAVVELSLKDGVMHLRSFAKDVGADARKKAVSWTAGGLLVACGSGLLVLANAIPSMFGFLNPILRILGIG